MERAEALTAVRNRLVLCPWLPFGVPAWDAEGVAGMVSDVRRPLNLSEI